MFLKNIFSNFLAYNDDENEIFHDAADEFNKTEEAEINEKLSRKSSSSVNNFPINQKYNRRISIEEEKLNNQIFNAKILVKNEKNTVKFEFIYFFLFLR